MKKWIIFCLFSFAPAVSLFCQTGYILSVSGTVTIQTGDGVSEASAGLILKEGDTVITGRNSQAELVIENDEVITLEQNSTFTLNNDKKQKKGFVKRSVKGLWRIVSKKFSDTEYSNAAVGTVGAIRGKPEGNLKDSELMTTKAKELSDLITEVRPNPHSPYSASEIVIIGSILESYSQFASAEVLYKQGIEAYPQEKLVYDMLIDLYMNNGFFNEAKDIYEKRLKKCL